MHIDWSLLIRWIAKLKEMVSNNTELFFYHVVLADCILKGIHSQYPNKDGSNTNTLKTDPDVLDLWLLLWEMQYYH